MSITDLGEVGPLIVSVDEIEEFDFPNFGAPPFLWQPLLGNSPVQAGSNFVKVLFRPAQQAYVAPGSEPPPPPPSEEPITQEELDAQAALEAEQAAALLAANTLLFESQIRLAHEASKFRTTSDGHYYRPVSTTSMLVNVSREGGYLELINGDPLSNPFGHATALWMDEDHYFKNLASTGTPFNTTDGGIASSYGELVTETEITIHPDAGAVSPPLPQLWPGFEDTGIQDSFEFDMTTPNVFGYSYILETYGTVLIREVIGLADQAKADAAVIEQSYGSGSGPGSAASNFISFPKAPNTIMGVRIYQETIAGAATLSIVFFVAIGGVFALSGEPIPPPNPPVGAWTTRITGAQQLKQKVVPIKYALARYPVGFNINSITHPVTGVNLQANFAGTYLTKNAISVTATGNLGFTRNNGIFRIYEIADFTIRGNPYVPVSPNMTLRIVRRGGLSIVDANDASTPIHYPTQPHFDAVPVFTGGLRGSTEIGGLGMNVSLGIIQHPTFSTRDLGVLRTASNFNNGVDGVFILSGVVATIINMPITPSDLSIFHDSLRWRQYMSWNNKLKDGDPSILWPRIPILLKLRQTNPDGSMLFDLWGKNVWESRIGFAPQPLKPELPSGGFAGPFAVTNNYTPLGKGTLVEIVSSSHPFVITGENAGKFVSWSGVGKFTLGGATSNKGGVLDGVAGVITLYEQSSYTKEAYAGPLLDEFGQPIQVDLPAVVEEVNPKFEASYLRNRDYTGALIEYTVSNDPSTPGIPVGEREHIYFFSDEES